MKIDELVLEAKQRRSIQYPFKKFLEEYLQKVRKLQDQKGGQVDLLVMPKAEFTPIVAHVVIKNKEAENKLEQILNGNELYIDYTQSLISYKAEQK